MANTSTSTMRFAAAEKTSEMINRKAELKLIHQTIYGSGTSLRVVFLRGPRGAEGRHEPEGGYGKTRLLEEVARLTQSEGAWHASGEAAVSQLIDLIDIRLHAQSNFLHAARDSFLGQADFMRYDDAFNRYRRRASQGMEHRAVREAADKADQSFLVDYRKNAGERRMVWLLDTVEQLAVNSSAWLLDRNLLRPEDMKTRTLEWLKRQIADDTLPNTTLICAGRGREGKWFFDQIAAAAEARHGAESIVEVFAEPFSVEDTRQYFTVLAQDLRQRSADEPLHPYQRLAKGLDELARRDLDRAQVVRLYTGGVPVRLALYAQLLVEGRNIPEQLQRPWAKVVEEVQTEDPLLKPTPELALAQWQVEDHFINLLFNPRDTTDRRSRILQTLVRAQRGLTAEQLYFVLENTERVSPSDWERLIEWRRVREIEEQLKAMAQLFLVKRRSPWWQLWDAGEGPALGAERHGLQDEIYRIYAEHMSLGVESRDERLEYIWENQSDAERERYTANRETEKKARDRLYTQLRDWARYQQDKLQAIRLRYQTTDERGLHIVDLTEARQINFPSLSETERSHRIAIAEAVLELELEHMHYGLLLDPEKGFNENYIDTVNEQTRAVQEEAEYLTQAAMWRVLLDGDALKFVDFTPRRSMIKRNETPLQVLRRAAQQEDASRWIKRFVVHKEYKRALEFARDVERAVDDLRRGSPQEQNDWASWTHTFTRGDRLCWSKYAQILLGVELDEATRSLEAIAQDLEALADHTVLEVVIPADRTPAGRSENGFKGTEDVGTHPGYVSLNRIISYVYNNLGYTYVNLGRLRRSIECYGKALRYIDETGALAQRSNVLNNLSRALSDMGRELAVRVCRDGLDLRRSLGAEVPIAYSHNTLALIYNDRNRPEDAWPEAAKAVAYFRRAEEPRGLGLALVQLGEALRLMAGQARFRRVLPADADSIYSAAEDVLSEAHSLFMPAVPDAADYAGRIDLNEPMRLVEAKIEIGCLFRDRIRAIEEDKLAPRWALHYREAQNHLTEAIAMARQLKLKRHEIDARINLAWTHYIAEKFDETDQTLAATDELLKKTNRDCFIREKLLQEPEGFAPDPHQQDEISVFRQISKMCNLRGLMAHRRFKQRVDVIEQEHPEDNQRELRQRLVENDTEAQRALEQLAEQYTLGTAYAQLYSPRSSALSLLYDRLYDFLKKFNRSELDAFHRHVNYQQQRYPLEQIKRNIEDMGNIDQFMHEVFGLSPDILKDSGGADGN